MNRLPSHIGVIPDGNRRWAMAHRLPKEDGYQVGLRSSQELFKICQGLGVKELTFYGFTQDNIKRPEEQIKAFQKGCVDLAQLLSKEDAELLVMGNSASAFFPRELLPYTKRTTFGNGGMRVNLLVNYGWLWDLSRAMNVSEESDFLEKIYSSDISSVELIIRWGGRKRLSGFLPVQSAYSDFYFIDAYWPDFKPEHFHEALEWYDGQNITMGR
jgi:undecaprenyl diphosphate synthase